MIRISVSWANFPLFMTPVMYAERAPVWAASRSLDFSLLGLFSLLWIRLSQTRRRRRSDAKYGKRNRVLRLQERKQRKRSGRKKNRYGRGRGALRRGGSSRLTQISNGISHIFKQCSIDIWFCIQQHTARSRPIYNTYVPEVFPIVYNMFCLRIKLY